MSTTTKTLPMVMVALSVATAGCNIFALDNYEEPNAIITGRVVYQNQPIGVRNNGVQLELWEPEFIEKYGVREKIPVHVRWDGTFSAMVFDGTYKLNLLPNNGPWVNSSDTLTIHLRGRAEVDFPVTPYYTVIDPQFTRGAPTEEAPGGTITATFRVGQIDTSRPLEYVGLYIGVTTIVDRNNSVPIPNSQRERTRTEIQESLDANQPISITVTLPENIYSSNSPWRRDFVFARIGIKTAGVAEMLFSETVEVGI